MQDTGGGGGDDHSESDLVVVEAWVVGSAGWELGATWKSVSWKVGGEFDSAGASHQTNHHNNQMVYGTVYVIIYEVFAYWQLLLLPAAILDQDI